MTIIHYVPSAKSRGSAKHGPRISYQKDGWNILYGPDQMWDEANFNVGTPVCISLDTDKNCLSFIATKSSDVIIREYKHTGGRQIAWKEKDLPVRNGSKAKGHNPDKDDVKTTKNCIKIWL